MDKKTQEALVEREKMQSDKECEAMKKEFQNKLTKKDIKRFDVVEDLKHAVWLLRIEIEDKDRKHASLIKMASKHMVQLAKQASTITELRQEVSRLQRIILKGEGK